LGCRFRSNIIMLIIDARQKQRHTYIYRKDLVDFVCKCPTYMVQLQLHTLRLTQCGCDDARKAGRGCTLVVLPLATHDHHLSMNLSLHNIYTSWSSASQPAGKLWSHTRRLDPWIIVSLTNPVRSRQSSCSCTSENHYTTTAEGTHMVRLRSLTTHIYIYIWIGIISYIQGSVERWRIR
jgi:hypothetical protein